MFFNSIEFSIFLPIVFAIYWILAKKTNLQNLVLLIASYVFYGWWDERFLLLIIFSSLVDFSIGKNLEKTSSKRKRKLLLATSLTVNLGLLSFFKYYNFFAESFSDAFTLLGTSIEVSRLNIILPVGISFYTFQTLSYTIDIYRKKIKANRDIVSFLAFVSFFPQLVAGPIERASNLLPQFKIERKFNAVIAIDGLKQILWGFFKKIVIADNCAIYANLIFNDSANCMGSELLLAAIFFSFQIYCDFSGYSDIAIGTAKLFGFNLMKNFSFPYFSRDMAEFWRRWHISLSTWFRDYLYIPLGGSRGNKWTQVRNTFIIFIVSGFWHGANWTFILWGFLNALYFLPLLLSNRNRRNLNTIADSKILPSIKETFAMLSTFLLTVIAWVAFRAESIEHAFQYYGTMFSKSILSIPIKKPQIEIAFILVIFVIAEWLGRKQDHVLKKLNLNTPMRYFIYYLIIFLIFWFAKTKQEFIYFQF